eukprot:515054-Hanusia_phi.AAC.1
MEEENMGGRGGGRRRGEEEGKGQEEEGDCRRSGRAHFECRWRSSPRGLRTGRMEDNTRI